MKVVKQNKYLHVEKITPIYKYGFRAECVHDIIEFQNNLISNKLNALIYFNSTIVKNSCIRQLKHPKKILFFPA